jgi:hypothetical protein
MKYSILIILLWIAAFLAGTVYGIHLEKKGKPESNK